MARARTISFFRSALDVSSVSSVQMSRPAIFYLSIVGALIYVVSAAYSLYQFISDGQQIWSLPVLFGILGCLLVVSIWWLASNDLFNRVTLGMTNGRRVSSPVLRASTAEKVMNFVSNSIDGMRFEGDLEFLADGVNSIPGKSLVALYSTESRLKTYRDWMIVLTVVTVVFLTPIVLGFDLSRNGETTQLFSRWEGFLFLVAGVGGYAAIIYQLHNRYVLRPHTISAIWFENGNLRKAVEERWIPGEAPEDTDQRAANRIAAVAQETM